MNYKELKKNQEPLRKYM